jgi:hypothetical protein
LNCVYAKETSSCRHNCFSFSCQQERINLINKRINNEKEKIFELKLNIQLKTVPSVSSDQLALLASKSQLPQSEKELAMTKL